MFNIGGGEVVVIALLALIVLGPQRLPEAARQIGKTLRDIRRVSTGFQDELRGALEDEPKRDRVPRRDVLGQGDATPVADAPMRDALRSVSDQAGTAEQPPARTAARPAKPSRAGERRRKPLVAEPTSNGDGAPRKQSKARKAAKAPARKSAGGAARRPPGTR